MSDSFYKAFEDRHRGSREFIKKRLQVYLPFVEQLEVLDEARTAVDLGCGRGEWVELLGEHGVAARGVDLDEDMLNECRGRDLHVQHGDAIAFLARLPDESEAVVSGFHIAEHLLFPDLKELVTEAFRVLRPAGLLILETPNPENLVVGASTFYTDPTHVRPLPPDLLSFLAEHSGFARTKVVRLNEASDAEGESPASLKHVLTGVSPDYSIVAQKAAPGPMLRSFDALFDRQYGLTLNALVTRYEESLTQKLDTIISNQKTERAALESELEAVYSSRSWRFTRPLRWLQDLLTWLASHAVPAVGGLLRLPGRVGRWLLARSMGYVLGRPEFSAKLNNQLMRFSRLHEYLLRFAHRHSLHDGTGPSLPHGNQGPGQSTSLNPRARRIYYQLLDAIRRTPGGTR